MDKKTQQTADFYRLVAWADANRKRLIGITVGVVAAGVLIGGYVWQSFQKEASAAEQLSALKQPGMLTGGVTAADAEPYLRLAAKYPNTSGGSLAMLRGAGILFEAGNFTQARAQFEKFQTDYAESPLMGQAAYGFAACLDAEGRQTEAISRYEDFLRRRPGDACAEQVKTSLARLYAAQNKPEQAMQMYRDVAQANPSSSWAMEAHNQAEDLAIKFPNLKKEPAPPPTMIPAPVKPDKL